MSILLKGMSLFILLRLLQQQLKCTDSFQIHTVCSVDLILPFRSKSKPLDSFKRCFVDICVIVSIKQELAINMKVLNLLFPFCFFVVLDHMSFQVMRHYSTVDPAENQLTDLCKCCLLY